jgi:hypothetical protein
MNVDATFERCLWRLKVIVRTLLALVFLHEGIVPKLLHTSAQDLRLTSHAPGSLSPQTALMCVAVADVAGGAVAAERISRTRGRGGRDGGAGRSNAVGGGTRAGDAL